MTQQYGEYDPFDYWEAEGDPTQAQPPAPPAQSGGKKFREQFESLLAQNAELVKTLKDERDQRSRDALQSRVESRGFAPEVASLIPQGLSQADQDKWLEDRKHLFAAKQAAPGAPNTPTPGVPTPNDVERMQQEEALALNLTPGEQAAMSRMANQGQGTETPAANPTDPMTWINSVDPKTSSMSEDEFYAKLRSMG